MDEYEGGGDWSLTIENDEHNHTATLPGAHPSLRKLPMDDEVINVIKQQSKAENQTSSNSYYTSPRSR